jgi:hypothetical protein
MATREETVKPLGLRGTLGIILVLCLLYVGGGPLIQEVKYRVCPPIRVYISQPGWGCDDYGESFTINKTEYPTYWAKQVFPREAYLKPFPRGQRGDTSAFRRYYARMLSQPEDTILLVGKFGLKTVVGEHTLFGQCDPIPYFEAQTIYTKRGRLLKRF